MNTYSHLFLYFFPLNQIGFVFYSTTTSLNSKCLLTKMINFSHNIIIFFRKSYFGYFYRLIYTIVLSGLKIIKNLQWNERSYFVRINIFHEFKLKNQKLWQVTNIPKGKIQEKGINMRNIMKSIYIIRVITDIIIAVWKQMNKQ